MIPSSWSKPRRSNNQLLIREIHSPRVVLLSLDIGDTRWQLVGDKMPFVFKQENLKRPSHLPSQTKPSKSSPTLSQILLNTDMSYDGDHRRDISGLGTKL